MQTPSMTHRQFLILSVLLDGNERRTMEIREAVQFSGRNSSFICSMHWMHARGLVAKYHAVVRVHDAKKNPVQKMTLWSITEAGRQAWQETLDFYLWFAKQFQKRTSKPADRTVLHRERIDSNERIEHLYELKKKRSRITTQILKNSNGKQPGRPRKQEEKAG